MARRTVDAQSVEVEIARLADLDLATLRKRWQQLYGNPPPKSLRKAFLIKAVAYGIQAKAFGGLKPATKRRLRTIAEAARTGASMPSSSSRRIKPGVRLVRAWKNQTHIVTVLADGSFEWNGTRHRSLSAIAKEITGTSWNGRTFFGMKKRSAGRVAGAKEIDATAGVAAAQAGTVGRSARGRRIVPDGGAMPDGGDRGVAIRGHRGKNSNPTLASTSPAPSPDSVSQSEISTHG